MDMNEYAIEVLVRERMADMRAEAQRRTQARALRREVLPLRVALGHALIRWGSRLQGLDGQPLATIDAARVVDEARRRTHGAVRG